MAATEEPTPESFQKRNEKLAQRGESLREIERRIRHLRAELDALNERADERQRRERSR